jgi:hypothetical protein
MAYTPPTLLDIKKGVSAQLGKTDYSTPNVVRDIKINDARRELYSSKRWSFRRKNQTLGFVGGVCAFPDLFAPSDDPIDVYEYPVAGQPKLEWNEVNLEDVGSYTVNDTGTKVYAIDVENSQFTSNQTAGTPVLGYYSMPRDRALDGSEDSLPEPASRHALAAIILLATAGYWLAAERDEDEYDRFMSRYKGAYALAGSRDDRVGAPVRIRHPYYGKNLGFNRSRI